MECKTEAHDSSRVSGTERVPGGITPSLSWSRGDSECKKKQVSQNSRNTVAELGTTTRLEVSQDEHTLDMNGIPAAKTGTAVEKDSDMTRSSSSGSCASTCSSRHDRSSGSSGSRSMRTAESSSIDLSNGNSSKSSSGDKVDKDACSEKSRRPQDIDCDRKLTVNNVVGASTRVSDNRNSSGNNTENVSLPDVAGRTAENKNVADSSSVKKRQWPAGSFLPVPPALKKVRENLALSTNAAARNLEAASAKSSSKISSSTSSTNTSSTPRSTGNTARGSSLNAAESSSIKDTAESSSRNKSTTNTSSTSGSGLSSDKSREPGKYGETGKKSGLSSSEVSVPETKIPAGKFETGGLSAGKSESSSSKGATSALPRRIVTGSDASATNSSTSSQQPSVSLTEYSSRTKQSSQQQGSGGASTVVNERSNNSSGRSRLGSSNASVSTSVDAAASSSSSAGDVSFEKSERSARDRGGKVPLQSSRVYKTVRTDEQESGRRTHEDSGSGTKRLQPLSSLICPVEKRKIMSLEEMLKKKKTEDQSARVVFKTKKQREQEKAEEEKRRREQERRKEQQLLLARRNFLMQEALQRERETKERMKHRELEKIKDEQDRRLREARTSGAPVSAPPTKEKSRAEEDRAAKKAADEKNNSSQQQSSRYGNSSNGNDTSSGLADLSLLNLPEKDLRARQQERELEQIRNHYLGLKSEKKKIQKPSEKFRNIFNFEWNDSEDTCKGDNNPLYQSRREPQLLFGRGFRAGMDIREQRKQNNFYDELVKRRQEQQREEQARGAAAAAAAAAAQATEAVRAAREALQIRVKEKEEEEDKRGHWTTKRREDMDDRDWRIFREDFEIYIKGGRVPPPIRTWAESDLPWELIKAVKQAKYDRPTPIQMQAIPIALEQRDLIGIAETGSGKTAAFVLPMLTYVKALPPLTEETCQDGPYALILAPSRELALQIDEETQKFASFCKCKTVAVVGGRSAETQAFQLRRGADIVIGTPGRVKDCLEKAYTVLNQCNYVVLDEADRMIDMGFEEIVNFILDQIPTSNLKSNDEALLLQQEMQAKAGHRLYRLTQMFSATMPPAVERLARKYLRQPSYISIGDPGAGKRSIEQKIEFVPEARKKQRLQEVLEAATPPVMVFVNQKKSADALARVLSKLGYSACSLHGGKAQENREAALSSFKEGGHDVLVATDVAGRGIDVEGVQLVVNFDMPKDIEAYTHRIGRTGRAGKKGLAISFLTEEDSSLFYDLKQLLVTTNNIVPMELLHHPAAKAKGGDKNTIKPMWFN